MESAFGIEHGYEIEKGVFGGIESLGTKAVTRGNAMRRTGAASIRSSKSLALSPEESTHRFKTGTQQLKRGTNLKRIGSPLANHPTAVGVGAIGAGAAGVGGGAALYANRRQ
jgi:hypothetical protein